MIMTVMIAKEKHMHAVIKLTSPTPIKTRTTRKRYAFSLADTGDRSPRTAAGNMV